MELVLVMASGSPVLDQPVILGPFSAIPHDQHTVVKVRLGAHNGVVHTGFVQLHTTITTIITR